MQSPGVVQVVPSTKGPNLVRGFDEGPASFPERNYTLTGVSRDSVNAPLGSCVCELQNTATKIVEQTTTSDASGNYSFVVDKTQAYRVLFYKAGAPDVFGTTANTLAGA